MERVKGIIEKNPGVEFVVMTKNKEEFDALKKVLMDLDYDAAPPIFPLEELMDNAAAETTTNAAGAFLSAEVLRGMNPSSIGSSIILTYSKLMKTTSWILWSKEKNMKCSELEKDRPVVCKVWDCAHEKQEITDGSVIYVLPARRTVCVGYMDGYHYRTDDVPYEDMIAAYDPNGEEMKFDNIRGKSVLLIAD